MNGGCQKCPNYCKHGCDNFYSNGDINFTSFASNEKKVKEFITRKNFNQKNVKLLCRCQQKETFNQLTKQCEKCPQGCVKCLIDKKVNFKITLF